MWNTNQRAKDIHPKSESPRSLCKLFWLENAKTTKFPLFAGLILPFLPNYVQSLLKSYIKTVKQIIFSTQITFCQNIIVMLTEKQAPQTFLLFGCICMGGRGQQLKMCFVLRRSCWLPPNSFFSHTVGGKAKPLSNDLEIKSQYIELCHFHNYMKSSLS